MKKIATALAAALALAVTTVAAIPDAAACGGYGAVFRPERARGQWPSVVRAADAPAGQGTVQLELHYPRFGRGEALSAYMDRFDVLDDDMLQRLERRLARPDGHALVVSIEEVVPGLWHVTGWTKPARA